MQWVDYSVDADGVAIISMNRPDRLNAGGSEMARDEIRIYNMSSHSADAIEGFAAHVQRRTPAWRS